MTLTAHEQADVLMDLAYSKDSNSEFVDKKIEYLQMTNQLDFQAAYLNLFYLLWHTNLPCFETTQSNGERSLFKYCEWKGKSVPCSAIFSSFPTDAGTS